MSAMRSAWLLLLMACGEGSTTVAAPALLRDEVARVDGEGISRGEVERLAASAGIAPREALHDLISERLLVAHARRAGYGEQDAVRRAEAQALVRVLLDRELGVERDPVRIEGQRAKLASLLARLAAQAKVQFHEDTIARAFAPVR
ncbi:MAG TPA: hypothetical protein VI299_15540 [Polyangiales bacterium]